MISLPMTMKPISQTASSKGKKNNLVQIFRAFAIIAVVMIHSTPMGMTQVVCRPLINFAVATFLFLSGYLTKTENDHWGAFCKRRVTRVAIPYILWTVMLTLGSGNLRQLPHNLLTAQAAGPLYYLLVYMQFVVLTPLLGKLARSRYQFLGWLVAPTALVVFKYYCMLTGQDEPSHASLLMKDSCLGWFTFYYLGLLLGNRIIEKHYQLKMLIVLYVLSLILQMAEGYGWMMLGDGNYGTQLKLSALLSSTLFLLIIYQLLNSRFDVRSRFLRLIGDYSFGIYLCHILVQKALTGHVAWHNAIPYPVNAVIILLISLGCCVIGHRLCGERLSRWIGFR